jgi:hypothetical protein
MNTIRMFSLAAVAALLGACATAPQEKPAAAAPVAAKAPVGVNISGSWALNVETPMGARDMKLNATQTGEALTGVIATERGELPITGTVKGNAVAFMMKVNAQGMDLQVDYAGTVDGGAMKGTVKLGDFGEGSWTGKKQ